MCAGAKRTWIVGRDNETARGVTTEINRKAAKRLWRVAVVLSATQTSRPDWTTKLPSLNDSLNKDVDVVSEVVGTL